MIRLCAANHVHNAPSILDNSKVFVLTNTVLEVMFTLSNGLHGLNWHTAVMSKHSPCRGPEFNCKHPLRKLTTNSST